jgi:hypothetical protein
MAAVSRMPARADGGVVDMEFVVSPGGVATNDGSVASPWPLQKGLDELHAGDVLLLRGGTYFMTATMTGGVETPDNPIVIRSFPGEHAVLDGATIGEFRVVPNESWEPVGNGEFRSRATFMRTEDDRARGSFLDRVPYTRLISYSRVQDLRAGNQLFGELPPGSPLPGFEPLPGNKRRPWVYMGPGLFHAGPGGPDVLDDVAGPGHIHIRLSPTANNVPGLDDYAGPSDPRQVPLAVWTAREPTLKLVNCTSVHLQDLTIRHGTRAVRLENCTDVRLDHVTVLAGPHGVDIGENCHGCMMTDCVVDGGLPTWYFRSDRKDGYRFTASGNTFADGLGETTLRALLEGHGSCTCTTIRNCEFVNGHDLLLFGTALEFSRNWVFNLNDDAIFAETRGVTDLQIFENVVEQCLTGISFAAGVAGNGVAVYRNLFDLRRPTAGRRPQADPAAPDDPDNPKDPLRLGQLFKSDLPDGPLDLFHNTVVVKDQTGRASFTHLNDAPPDNPRCPFMPRRSFNNIFVVVNTVPQGLRPVSWLPNPTWPAATDGNCYFRAGEFPNGELFRHFAYSFPGEAEVSGAGFSTLEELRGDGSPALPPSAIFKHSTIVRPPGFEASSIAEDPLFRHVPAAHSSPEDDFGLRPESPCRGTGVVLPADLRVLDEAPPHERPDIGCFRSDAPSLSVGVDGHRTFPAS